jgi:hypothetical protein
MPLAVVVSLPCKSVLIPCTCKPVNLCHDRWYNKWVPGKTTTLDCLEKYCEGIIDYYGAEFSRQPTVIDKVLFGWWFCNVIWLQSNLITLIYVCLITFHSQVPCNGIPLCTNFKPTYPFIFWNLSSATNLHDAISILLLLGETRVVTPCVTAKLITIIKGLIMLGDQRGWMGAN